MKTSGTTVFSVFCYALGLVLLLCTTAWSVPAHGGPAEVSRAESILSDCELDDTAPVIVYPAAGLHATIEGCNAGQPAVFFFSITVADDCDPNPVLEVEFSNDDTASLSLSNPYGNHFLLTALPGSYEITIIASDTAGNGRQEIFAVEVGQEPVPGTSYGCNDTIIVTLDEDCQRLITPDMILEGDIGCLPAEYFDIQVIDEVPGNGPVVDGTGTYPVELNPQQVDAVAGFTLSADPGFWLLSNRDSAATRFSADTLFQSVNASGGWSAAVLPIDFGGVLHFDWATSIELADSATFSIQVLNPDGTVAIENLYNNSDAGSFESPVTQGQVLVLNLVSPGVAEPIPAFSAFVTNWNVTLDDLDLSAAFPCWGMVVARDQTPPSIICPPNTDAASVMQTAQQLTGAITAQSPAINVNVHSCLSGDLPVSGDRFYDVIVFEVDQPGVFTFFSEYHFFRWWRAHGPLSGGLQPTEPVQ
jgi:hypothetical protein